jgi:hypothetical protein
VPPGAVAILSLSENVKFKLEALGFHATRAADNDNDNELEDEDSELEDEDSELEDDIELELTDEEEEDTELELDDDEFD